VPQQTRQKRLQWDDGMDWTHGKHNLHFGGQFQRIGADFNLGVSSMVRSSLFRISRTRTGTVTA
jgi:hypothetical protein